MKKLLKYFIPVILVAITFISGINKSDSMVSRDSLSYTIAQTTLDESFTVNSDLYLPCPTSCTNTFHLPKTSKRTNTVHKNQLEFIKSNKIINTGIKNFIYKESLIVYSSFIKPIHRLISLGKLII